MTQLNLDFDFRTLPEQMAPGSIVRVAHDLNRNGKTYLKGNDGEDVLLKGTDCIIIKHEHRSKVLEHNTWLVSAVGHDEPWILHALEFEVLFMVKIPKPPEREEWYDY